MNKRIEVNPGDRYGRLVVIHELEPRKRMRKCLCICDCGEIKAVYLGNLRNGYTKSCGCLHSERTKEASTIHGKYNSRLYNVWCCMLARCLNPNNTRYLNYGGRGVQVCEEWRSFYPFYLWALNSGYNDGLTIDRRDNDGNYDPSNCRWATQKEQSNNRRTNILLTFKGRTMTIMQWAEVFGIGYGTLRDRIKIRNWSVERALTTPVQIHRS